MCVCVTVCLQRSEDDFQKSPFPSTMWVLGIKHRPAGLALVPLPPEYRNRGQQGGSVGRLVNKIGDLSLIPKTHVTGENLRLSHIHEGHGKCKLTHTINIKKNLEKKGRAQETPSPELTTARITTQSAKHLETQAGVWLSW